MDNAPDMTEIETMPPPTLEQLERQVTAMLYAIWRVQGKSKRVVEVRTKEGHNVRVQGENKSSGL